MGQSSRLGVALAKPNNKADFVGFHFSFDQRYTPTDNYRFPRLLEILLYPQVGRLSPW